MFDKEKTLMILGAGQLQVPLLQRAKERGLKVIVVSPDITQPGMKYADEIVELDVRDEEGILKEAKRLGINGITTDQTDLPVRTAAYISEKMGLPSIGYEMGKLFTDKYAMRKKSVKLGLSAPAFIFTYSVEEAKEFFRKNGTSILKPIDSQSSHGVYKIEKVEDINNYFLKTMSYSRTKGVLLEQWIDGIEFPVDSYVFNGKCTVMALGQYHPFSQRNVFSSCLTLWPANQAKHVLDLIEETNRKLVEGCGLHTARTHAEYIVSGDKCYLIEIGARGGGVFISSDVARCISGICSEDFLIDFALGNPLNLNPDESIKCKCCCTLFFYLPEGTVQSIDGIDRILEENYVGRHNFDQITLNMKTFPFEDKAARYFIVLKATNHEELHRRIQLVRNQICIVVKTKEGDLRPLIWM